MSFFSEGGIFFPPERLKAFVESIALPAWPVERPPVQGEQQDLAAVDFIERRTERFMAGGE